MALPPAARLVVETFTAVPVVRPLACTFTMLPASWLLENTARLPVDDDAPDAETLKIFPVYDCARTFTAPTVYDCPWTVSVPPDPPEYNVPSETSIALPVVRFFALIPRTVPAVVWSAVSATSVPVKFPVLRNVFAP